MTDLIDPLEELPTPDLARLRKAVDWVDEQAAKTRGGEWYQARWRTKLYAYSDEDACGTAYCLAGHVVQEAGADWLSDDYLAATPDEAGSSDRWGSQQAVFVADRARRLLGITEDEGSDLFGALNTPDRIRTAAERIAARVGETL